MRLFTSLGTGKPRAHQIPTRSSSAKGVQIVELLVTNEGVETAMEKYPTSMPDLYVRSAKADLLFGALYLMTIANVYWLWLSYELGSPGMLVLGMLPIFWVVTGSVSIYALLFDVPGWVITAFT